jgi:hypothetical protein
MSSVKQRAAVLVDVGDLDKFSSSETRFDVAVPITPAARAEAERAGITCLLAETLVGQTAHEAMCQRVESEVDAWLDEVNRFYSARQASHGSVGEHFRTVAYNHLARYAAIAQLLDGAARDYDVSWLRRSPAADPLLTADARDVVAAVAASRTEMRPLGVTGDDGPPPPPAGPDWKRTIARAGSNGLLWLRAARGGQPGAAKALVLNGFRQWLAIASHPSFRAPVRFEFSDIAEERGPAPPTGLPADLVERLAAVVGPRIPRRAIEDFAARVVCHVEFIDRNRTRIETAIERASLVVGCVFDQPLGRYCCDRARRMGRDVVVFQHGAMNLHPEPRHLTAVEADATQYLSWGTDTEGKDALLRSFGHLKRTWIVGAVRNKVAYQGGRTVVYATGKYGSNTLMSHYVDPDRRLYDAQKTLIAFFEGQEREHAPGVDFVVKANNTPGANAIPFPTSLRVDAESPFTDHLATAKAVVLDAPATTCVEAAATRVPLFVLMGRARWFDAAAARLSKRAVTCDTVDDLAAAVRRFLADGTYPADVGNTEFADAYAGTETPDVSVHKISAVFESLVREPAHAG